MGAGHETARRIAPLDRLAERRQRVERRVVVLRQARGALSQAEMHEQRGHVVRQHPLLFAGRAHRVAHHHVAKEA